LVFSFIFGLMSWVAIDNTALTAAQARHRLNWADEVVLLRRLRRSVSKVVGIAAHPLEADLCAISHDLRLRAR
jgi:hypothetical protein